MENNFNDIIVKSVLKHIPEHVAPVSCIMEILGLSKETAYRRLRQEIPFTFSEVSKLALSLDFSIDELIESSKKETFSFDLQSKIIAPDSDAYIGQFYAYNHYLKKINQAKNSEVLIALNELPPLFLILSEQLFKFSYFRWLHKSADHSCDCSFTDLTLDPQLLSQREETYANITKVNNVSIIASGAVFLNTIKSIRYAFQCKLITVAELLLLRDAMLEFVNLAEQLSKNGYFDKEAKVDFYLSSLNINSNILFLKYDKVEETHLWIYPSNPLLIRNSEICEIQKEWIHSLKKQAMLITLSNEILQAEFYQKQRKYIENYLAADSGSTYGY